MGLFSGLKRELDKQQIDKNGLSTATGWQKCDDCKYRMNDPKSDYYACYVHRIRVYANQICGHFSSGSPEYEIK